MRLLLLPLLLILASCSKLSIGVYWADTFVMSSLDDYFVMSADERQDTKKQFQEILLTVRREDFPRKADHLDRLAKAVQTESLTPAELETWIEEANRILRGSLQRFEPLGHSLVSLQVPQGFRRFDAEFLRKQEKKKKVLASAESLKKDERKRFDRITHETIGSLTQDQQKIVDAELPQSIQAEFEASRAALFTKFRSLREDTKRRTEFLTAYFRDWDSLQSAEYLAARATQQKQLRALLWKIYNTATKEQKAALIEKFPARAEELRKLAKI